MGDSTAEVFRQYNLDVELIAKDSTAESLAKELVATDSLDSANVLVVSGNRNREIMVDMLEGVGRAIVDTLPVYQTDFADVLEAPDFLRFQKEGADAIVFTSSSTALSYVEQSEDIVLKKMPLLQFFAVLVRRLPRHWRKMSLRWVWNLLIRAWMVCASRSLPILLNPDEA